jgi:hypothetical protein
MSAALEYLVRRGVDVGTQVRLVVASHWHDDHVRGLAGLLEAARSARFSCSVALRGPEFRALADHAIPVSSTFSSGVDEFRAVMKILQARHQVPAWASGAKRLLSAPSDDVSGVWALSPSDGDVDRALRRFSAHHAEPNAARIIPDVEPNDTAVAVLIELVDGSTILLGADVEHYRSESDRGWHGVLNDRGRPAEPARLYKVAHHGSSNAFCPAMWSHESRCRTRLADDSSPLLVGNETTCILTPWRRGQNELPKASDIDALETVAASVHLTASPSEAFGERQDAKRYRGFSFARSLSPYLVRPGALSCTYVDGSWKVAPTAIEPV